MGDGDGAARWRWWLLGAAAVCAGGAALVFVLGVGGPPGGGVDRSREAARGRDGRARRPSVAAPAARRDAAAGVEPAAPGAGAEPGDGAAPAPPPTRGLVDLYVLAGDGRGFFERGVRDVDPRLEFWVAPAIIEPDPVAGGRPDVIEWPTAGRGGGRAGEAAPGWYAAFPRPDRRADAAVLFGEAVVTRQRVPEDADEVRLRADGIELEALACTVEAIVPPPSRATSLRLTPMPAGFPRGRTLEPDATDATGLGRFEAIPPGRAVLRCGPDEVVLASAGRELADRRGVDGTPRWPRMPSREWLDLHLEAARALAPVTLEVELDLQPGDRRHLGTLVGEPSGAVVLRLTRDGEPVEARRFHARAVSSGVDAVLLSHGDALAVVGPPAGEARVFVTPGRGAGSRAGYAFLDVRFAALRPGAVTPEVTVELAGPAFFELPAGATLTAPDGRAVPVDLMSERPGPDGWRRFRGPAGRYVVTLEDGTAHAVDAPGGAIVDARRGIPTVLMR